MLGFRNAVNHGTPNKEVPIVIHCSAGVGRTGTYIAIDTLVKQALDMGGELDVDKVIASMRERRNYMVQTEVQYMFIYRCVLDGLTELLRGESLKAESLAPDDEEQAAIREAAAAAELARKEEEQREQAAIDAAKAVRCWLQRAPVSHWLLAWSPFLFDAREDGRWLRGRALAQRTGVGSEDGRWFRGRALVQKTGVCAEDGQLADCLLLFLGRTTTDRIAHPSFPLPTAARRSPCRSF